MNALVGKRSWISHFVAFSTVFVAGLFASPLVSYGFLPRILSNWLFFWPQVALVYYGFTVPAEDMTRTFLKGGPNFVIAAVFWAGVGFALSRLFRRRSVLLTLVASLPISFVVGWLALLALNLMNVGVYLEGP
jgi:hypothetical protein